MALECWPRPECRIGSLKFYLYTQALTRRFLSSFVLNMWISNLSTNITFTRLELSKHWCKVILIETWPWLNVTSLKFKNPTEGLNHFQAPQNMYLPFIQVRNHHSNLTKLSKFEYKLVNLEYQLDQSSQISNLQNK